MRLVAAALIALLSTGCVVVPQNRRAKLADPMMADADALEQQRRQKLYTSREGAAGGDGQSAGGGCACQ